MAEKNLIPLDIQGLFNDGYISIQSTGNRQNTI